MFQDRRREGRKLEIRAAKKAAPSASTAWIYFQSLFTQENSLLP